MSYLCVFFPNIVSICMHDTSSANDVPFCMPCFDQHIIPRPLTLNNYL